MLRKGSSSCCTGGTRRATLVTNPEISHECGKDRIVIKTNGTYQWSFVEHIIFNYAKTAVSIAYS